MCAARSLVFVAILLAAAAEAAAVTSNTPGQSIGLAEDVMYQITSDYRSRMIARIDQDCTPQEVAIRREWGDLSQSERKEYISAVYCISTLPSQTPASSCPGCRTRYDDFVYVHIINASDVHLSGLLLPWHRHLVWLYEKSLREECGYKGYQPYWDWSKYATFAENPLFDGSETSMSANGTPSIEEGYNCVAKGPMGNWTSNLGPGDFFKGPQLDKPNSRQDGLGYNPRCLKRTFNDSLLRRNSYENVVRGILTHSDIESLMFYIEIDALDQGAPASHKMPHLAVGGIQTDVYAPNCDPAFWMHHAMLDRVWAIWQSFDPEEREGEDGVSNAEYTTRYRVPLSWPPLPKLGLDTVLKYGMSWDNVTVKDVMSTVQGQYHYMYT